MESPDDVAERIAGAALDIVAARGWRDLSLADVARGAGLPLLDVWRAVPTKGDLPVLVVASVDRAMLADGPSDPADSPRDRLFDVVMRRLDGLQARRAGVVALLRGLLADPVALLRLVPRLARSLGWMLEAAGIPSGGPVGALRTEALALVWANALRVWLQDDTADMARTMASVDRDLARLERVAKILPFGSVGEAPGAGAPPEDRPDVPSAPSA